MENKIYGIYVGSFEGDFFQEPLYSSLEKAIVEAERLVAKYQKRVEGMHEHLLEDGDKFDEVKIYKNWKKINKLRWEGGAHYEDSVYIRQIDII